MKLDKYIKLTDEDVELLNKARNNALANWSVEDLTQAIKYLESKMVVVKPAGEES